MKELLLHIDPVFLVGIVAILCGCTTAVVAAVAKEWRKTRQSELDASLKHEMIARGMSADEIEKVLRAQSDPGRSSTPANR